MVLPHASNNHKEYCLFVYETYGILQFISPFFFFFLAIADLKNFTWCNVIQQIKKVSPNDVLISLMSLMSFNLYLFLWNLSWIYPVICYINLFLKIQMSSGPSGPMLSFHWHRPLTGQTFKRLVENETTYTAKNLWKHYCFRLVL